jgi:hypothetical protein
MTDVENPAGGPFQMPTLDAPAAPPGTAAVSPAGYWISGAILIVGLGIATVWFFITIFSLVNAPDDFDRIDVPGSADISLDSGEWVIYHEYAGAGTTFSYEQPEVEVSAPDGRELTVYNVSYAQTYTTTNGIEGVAIGEFVVSQDDTYTVDVLGEPRFNQRIAIGRPYDDLINLGHLGWSVLIGVVSFTAGLALLVITLVRRSRARRQRALASARTAGPPYGNGPYGPGPYGGAGWGTPPQPQWGPPGSPPPPQPQWGPPGSPPPPQPQWGPPGSSPPTAPPAAQPPHDPPPPTDPWGNPSA